MVRKILDGLAVLSFLLTVGIIGGGFMSYRYVTSPEFEKQIKTKLMGNVTKLMPKALDKSLPGMTGPAVPWK